ncbi:MAG: tRNA-guanine transglycosylase [Acidimicrobiales bacterium]
MGETRSTPALAAALEHLPPTSRATSLGVGDPASIVEAVGLGVDLFDCVLPTRHARHGTVLTSEGRLMIKNLPRLRATRARSTPPAAARSAPATAGPTCATCTGSASRRPPGSSRSTTSWLSQLVVDLRGAIAARPLDVARRAVLDVWG